MESVKKNDERKDTSDCERYFRSLLPATELFLFYVRFEATHPF